MTHSSPGGRRIPARKGLAAQAFTLVEVLVVMLILALLAYLVAPAVSGLLASRGVTSALGEISGLLELARSEAVARQTYVWVAFKNQVSADGSEIAVAAVYSADGTGTNHAATNLVPLARVSRSKGVAMVDWSALSERTRDLADLGGVVPTSVASNASQMAFRVGSVDFQDATVAFTPQGTASRLGTLDARSAFTPLLAIGVAAVRGKDRPSSTDDAAVLLDGAVGGVLTLRVQ